MVVQSPTSEHAGRPIIRGARRVLISRISDDLIETGRCPKRSGLRSFSVVLVNQATQEVTTSDRVLDRDRRDDFGSLRRNKVEPTMGSLAVVVLDVGLQHRSKMPLAQEEHPIEALGADRPDEPFGIGVGLRCPEVSEYSISPLTRDFAEWERRPPPIGAGATGRSRIRFP